MKKILLSLAPVSVETLKSMIQRSPGVPEFDVIDGHDMSEEELAKAFAKADVILGTWTFKRIGKDLVAKAGLLKLIQQPSVGYDNIDVKACSERGIRVANAPTGNTVTVAEHTIAMGLALVRKLAPANSSLRVGRWERLTLEPSELGGKTWGVVGFGKIGRAVALRLRPFELGQSAVLQSLPGCERGGGAVRRRVQSPADAVESERHRQSSRAVDRFHSQHD